MDNGYTDELAAQHEMLDDGKYHCSVSGRLDALSAPALTKILDDAHHARGDAGLILDLSTVTFIDSAALAVLVRTRKRCVSEGSEFVIVRPDADDAMRIFRLTMFDKVFTMIPSGKA